MANNATYGPDFKFNITLQQLATDRELLMNLNLISMYSDKDCAVEFFIAYLSAFIRNDPTELYAMTKLQILVPDYDMQTSLKGTDYIKHILHTI